MKRSKRHKVKQEMPDASTSRATDPKDHDLAYYIHDRVELMHQVFSVLKPKELKAMAPECVRHISINDLQELCMEELLGISSKRLCAILDGAEPPSDTESSMSSPDRLETISLDSISSDEEILSQISSKKSKKHKHRSKSKSKKRKSKETSDDTERQQEDKSRRAGLTMLELLELQARARAIRAQLQKEQALAAETEKPSETAGTESTDDEVEIKEEAAEVVEISSEDEKPNVQELDDRIATTRKEASSNDTHNSGSITKKVNDLVITVPQAKSSRKIKLKRNTCSNTSEKVVENVLNVPKTSTVADKTNTKGKETNSSKLAEEAVSKRTEPDETVDLVSDKGKGKDKKKKRKKDKQKEKEGSDHDEITLQLSDTEKMDLLEDLEGKNFEKSSETEDSSEDSDSESSSDDGSEKLETSARKTTNKVKTVNKEKDLGSKTADNSNLNKEKHVITEIREEQFTEGNTGIDKGSDSVSRNDPDEEKEIEKHLISNMETNESSIEITPDKGNENPKESGNEITKSNLVVVYMTNSNKEESLQLVDNMIEVTSINDIPLQSSDNDKMQNTEENLKEENNDEVQVLNDDKNEHRNNVGQKIQNNIQITIENDASTDKDIQKEQETSMVQNKNVENNKQKKIEISNKEDPKDKSEGELSDRDSSEVEASDVKADVVCISDEEKKGPKKKKKKDKKSKKVKKCKKNKDFRESADQNFYTQPKDVGNDNFDSNNVIDITMVSEKGDTKRIDITDSDSIKLEDNLSQTSGVIIIPENNENIDIKPVKTELSSQSELCNTEIDDDVYEILELSDDSSCYDVKEISISKEPTTEEIEALSAKLDEIERDGSINVNEIERDTEDLENVSWKDRYLKSTKVKKVLTTANILNAIRKKNLDLKKKLKDSKKALTEEAVSVENEDSNVLEEGSIQHYNTLETSTKFVDPVKEVSNIDNVLEETTGNKNNGESSENSNINKESGENEDTVNATDKENSTDPKDSSDKNTPTKEMKKDAKQLLKMYKMLLKYNDITKQKDSSKKKKKKKDKKKEKIASQASVAS